MAKWFWAAEEGGFLSEFELSDLAVTAKNAKGGTKGFLWVPAEGGWKFGEPKLSEEAA